MSKPLDSSWPLILQTTGARAYSAATEFASLIVTAYLLGPTGRGVVATIMIWSRMLASLSGLSLHQVALERLAATRRGRFSRVLATVIMLSLGTCILGWAAGVIYYLFTDASVLAEQPWQLLALGLLLVPLMQWDSVGSHLLTAMGRLGAYNFGLVLGRTLGFAVTVAGLVILGLGVVAPVLGGVVALGFVAALTSIALRRLSRAPLRLEAREARSFLANGLKLHPNTVGAFLLTHVDVLMLSEMRTMEEVGWYQAAAELSWAPLIFASMTALSLYGEITREGPDRAWLTQRVLIGKGLIVLAAIALFAYLAAPWLVPVALGAPFRPAVPVFRILLLAMLGMGAAQFMTPQWISRGLFAQTSLVTLTAGCTNVVLNLIFIPRYGMFAAAWTTVLSFSISLVVQGLFAWRISATASRADGDSQTTSSR